MLRTALPFLFASTMCVSCDGPAIAPSQSLVGAKELPSAIALARETIVISRGFDGYGGDGLTYEWRPNNSLLVTHTFSDGNGTGEVVRGKETLHIAPDLAWKVRQILWRVRPAKLEGQGLEKDEARPVGCQRKGPHDFGEVTIGFISERSTTTAEEAQASMFFLPSPASCNAPAGVESRKAVWQALRLLPHSQVAANFERAS